MENHPAAIIVYLIVGVLTTIVSWTAKFAANALFFDNTMYPTPLENGILSTINWVAGRRRDLPRLQGFIQSIVVHHLPPGHI